MKRPHLTVLLAVTLATMIFVASGMPGLAAVRGWFYHPVERGLGEALPLAVGAVGVPIVVWGALSLARRHRHGWAVLLLMVASLGAQLTFVLSDARGLDTALRWQVEGHGEIARIAHARRGEVLDTLRHYDTLIAERKLGAFLPSKPPGAYAVYAGVEALAGALHAGDWTGPVVTRAASEPRIGERAGTAAVAFWLFPLLTMLIVPLTFGLGWLVVGRRSAGIGAALVALTSPAALLIRQHLDGAVYPLLALGTVILAVRGARHAAPGWALASGLLWGISLYVSFSLLPVVGLVLGCLALVAVERGRRADPVLEAYRAGWQTAAFGLGTLAALVLLERTLQFHFAHRLTAALDYHEHWKSGVPTGPWRGWALVEFALYLSFPLAAALLWRAGRGALRLATQRFESEPLVAVGFVAFLGVLSAVGGTNEVARLWLFVVPFVAVVVAQGLPDAGRGGRWWAPASWLAACQVVVALVLEANQMW